MENKKGSLSTVFLVIAIILIVVMGALLYMQKTEADRQIAELENNASEMQETINDLQGKIDTISNTINSNTDTEDENVTADFTEKEIKDVLQMCLDLESAKTNGPGTALFTLGLYKDNADSDSEKSAEKTGFMKTSIKYTDFKEAMLKYMTEECYQKQWAELFENENGYLCYANVGATGVGYKVNSIEKVGDGYTANVTASSEGPDSKMTVSFKIDDNKCVVKLYEFK